MSFYKIYVGEMSQERKEDWFCKDNNPYKVCAGEPIIKQYCGGGDWGIADRMLRDHVNVDWGSIAWRANKDEVRVFLQACQLDSTKVVALETGKDYAVVFIECAPSDCYL